MTAQAFGPRLRELREARGLTQTALAEKIGGRAWQGKIGAWERGEIRPTVGMAQRIAAALDVSLLDLAPDLADLAYPSGTILLRQAAKGQNRYRAASKEHAAHLATIGWPEPDGEIAGKAFNTLLTLATERGWTVAFAPA